MEYKSFIVGILISIGIFAFKSGVGINYYFSSDAERRKKVLVVAGYTTAYFFVFLISHLALKKINLTEHFDDISAFLKQGMVIHVVMAVFAAIWGIILLRSRKSKYSHAWLVMAVPCPVCISAVFFSMGFLFTFFPEKNLQLTLMLYSVYIGITFVSALFLNFIRSKIKRSPESFLGFIMLAVSFYFLISIVLMPYFTEIEKVYKVASYSEQMKDEKGGLYIITIIIVSVLSGFIYKFFNIRRIGNWKY